jgi:outer membrane protein TolC
MIKKKVLVSVITPFVLANLFTGCTVQPESISQKEIKKDIDENLALLDSNCVAITAPISLDEAIHRAIEYNLQKQVSVMESMLSKEQIELITYETLPTFTANAGYSIRNNYSASASTSFSNGQPDPLDQDPSYSVSQSKKRLNADVGFSWNILDFGLSYIRAKQQSNKYLIAKEKEKKVIHNITQSVREAYYKALSADDLISKIKPVMKETKQAIQNSKKAKELRVQSSMETLTYQRELYDILRSLNSIYKSLISAKTELSELMGLKPGTDFNLQKMTKDEYQILKIPLNLEDMEKIAIQNRPEIHESRYNQKISEQEIDAVKLSILPKFGINTNIYFDDSQYMLNNNWFNYGTSVSWNLMNLFTYDKKRDYAQKKVDISKQQKLAIYMAVLSQVHLSYVQFQQSQSEYILSKEYLEVADEIFDIVQSQNRLNLNSKLVLIKEKLNYILATLRHSTSYAQMQNSYGKILVSIGNLKAFDNLDTVLVNDGRKEMDISEEMPKQIRQNIIEKKQRPLVVTTTKVRAKVRSQPSTKSQYTAILEPNTEVVILKKIYTPNKGFWYKTRRGYMHSNVLNSYRKFRWLK